MINTLMTKISKLFIVPFIFLIGCNPTASQTIMPTNHVVISSTPNVQTPTFIPTQSNILELSNASELPLPTYKQECINNISDPNIKGLKKSLRDLAVDGVAVFTEYINNRDTIVFINLRTGEKRTIPENSTSTDWTDVPRISPNGQWLFYLTGTEYDAMGSADFVLSNSEGTEIKRLPVSIVESYGFDYQFEHKWLGNNSLKLFSQKNYKDRNLVILLLNPFTEQITQLHNDFDSVKPVDVNWGVDPFLDFRNNGTNIVYSPDNNFAFYPHPNGHDILYDITKHKELVQVIIPNWGKFPRWSPVKNVLSFIATPPNFSSNSSKQDFYLLSQDGKTLRRLTYLSEQFEKVSIQNYSWSSDGTKIAFWLNTKFPLVGNKEITYELAIIDIVSGNITNFCITEPSAKQLIDNNGFLIEPVWSQDSSNLLVEIHSVPNLDSETILVSPSKLSALAITKDAELNGWMINKP